MHENIDELTDAFTAHETLAPDAGDVLARASTSCTTSWANSRSPVSMTA